jgi:hypothetical protein
MGPIVLGVSFVLVLSAAALVPKITSHRFGAIVTVVAAWGFVRGIMSIVGIRKLKDEVHWSDVWFYGVAPSVLYLVLGWVALAVWNEWSWCREGIAAAVIAHLLLAIRNEWDLITWIAPHGEADRDYESLSG